MHNPLNIMHVVYSLHTGGLENGVVNLCNRLCPEKFALSICMFLPGGELEARVNTERVKVLATKAHLRNDPTLPFRLAWQLHRLQIDILHTHSWGTLVEGVAAAKLARTPTIIHGEHGVMEERPRNVAMQRWLWSRTQQVTSVADSLADRMSEVIGFPRDRIEVIPNGVDTDRFRPSKEQRVEWRRRYNLPEDSLVIGMVARLVPVKNHLGMLRALAMMNEQAGKVMLALAGSGPLLETLRQAAYELGVFERVRFLGEVVQVEHFLNALDVFVLNSHSEGMSNTILEAMACGIPVVATDIGSNSLLIAEGDAGYLIPVDNAESLARALEKNFREPLLREAIGKKARLRIEKHFGIERMVRDYEELYSRMASDSIPQRMAEMAKT